MASETRGRHEDLRSRADELLRRVQADEALRRRVIEAPRETLQELGIPADAASLVAEQWGVGPTGDCGSDTCRLTDPCGWTVCGKTTNGCFDGELDLRRQLDELVKEVESNEELRRQLVESPRKTLEARGLPNDVARYAGEYLGVGPSADCGSDTCRLTDPCGWTVCGKTTNSCGPDFWGPLSGDWVEEGF